MSSAARRAAALNEFAGRQAGLLTRRQLRELGADADYIRNQAAAGRWQAWGANVVALHTGPLADEQVAWLAVLDGGDDCVLAGLSALHQLGLTGFVVDRVQTAVPAGAGRPMRHDLYLRRVSRRLTPAAVHPVRLPPQMRATAALLDALENTRLPLRGCALLAAVVQQRLIRADQLRPLIDAERTLPHRRTYLRASGDIEGGAHSLNEIDFRRLARRAQIPAPRGQMVRLDRQGRKRYLDVDFDGFGVEVDGAIHLRPLAWWDDMFRLNDIAIRQKPMLRFPSVGIYLRPDEVMAQLRDAHRRWPGK